MRLLLATIFIFGSLLVANGVSAVVYFEPEEITFSTDDAWTDVDVTSYLGDSAGDVAGVFLLLVNTGANSDTGVRKNGSTDSALWHIINDSKVHIFVGVDSNDIFELYFDLSSGQDVYIAGYYTNDEASFDTNLTAIENTPQDATWKDVDISSETGAETALAAMILIDQPNNGVNVTWGLRENGSTDSIKITNGTGDIGTYSGLGSVISVDSNEIFEMVLEDVSQPSPVKVYLSGWITDNFTGFTNAKDYSETTTGSYQDVDWSSDIPADNHVAYYQLAGAFGITYSIRSNGDTDDLYYTTNGEKGFGIVGIDSSRYSEQKIETTSADLYLMGYGASLSSPLIETLAASNIEQTSATINGDLTSLGSADNVDLFFNYGTTSGVYTSTTTLTSTSSIGVFSEDLTSLTTLTEYFFRIGASSTDTFVYGDEKSFLPSDISTTTDTTSDWNLGTTATTTVGVDKISLASAGVIEDVDASPYCSAGESSAYFWISNVVFEDIDETTGEITTPGYGDYTNIKTQVTPGETHTITVTSGNDPVGSYTNCVWVWIDWDQDEVLTDETGYDLGCYTEPSSSHTYDIEIPSDFSGNTLMRVFLAYSSDPSGPCVTVSYAEVEDYSIGVSGYGEEGTWVSSAWDVGSIDDVDTSKIVWTDTTPASTTITAYALVNSSSSSPSGTWDTVTDGGTIPDVTGDLTGKYLWTKFLLETEDIGVTPEIDYFKIGINESTGPAPTSTRRIIIIN
jgi:hypothetical protein